MMSVQLRSIKRALLRVCLSTFRAFTNQTDKGHYHKNRRIRISSLLRLPGRSKALQALPHSSNATVFLLAPSINHSLFVSISKLSTETKQGAATTTGWNWDLKIPIPEVRLQTGANLKTRGTGRLPVDVYSFFDSQITCTKPWLNTSDDIALHHNNTSSITTQEQLLSTDLNCISNVSVSGDRQLHSQCQFSLRSNDLDAVLLGGTNIDSSNVDPMAEKPTTSAARRREESRRRGPTPEQLYVVKEHLAEYMPGFFLKAFDYTMTHADIVFENNYWGKNKISRGTRAYAWELCKIRAACHWKFVNAHMRLLKITMHPGDGTVCVRWRIVGIEQGKVFFTFYKFLPWNYEKAMEREATWHDGFSTFSVGKDGSIHKHRVERIMPDEELTIATNRVVGTALS